MKEIILVKYGEIALKGLNKSTFEDMLQKNIKRRLKKLGTFGFYRRQSTIYITPPEEADIDGDKPPSEDIRHQRDTALRRIPEGFQRYRGACPRVPARSPRGRKDLQGGIQAQRQGVPDEDP